VGPTVAYPGGTNTIFASNGNSSRVVLAMSDGNTASLFLSAGAGAPGMIGTDTPRFDFRTGILYAWGENSGITVMTLNGDRVGIGTTNPQHRLSVEGSIGAREVMVTNAPWSDYVFRPGYRLRPLSEVNAYIQAHHHLPDIPSETEVKAQGVSVGEMQAKLLAKIEELTLHMIEAEERSQRLERQNQELHDRVARLEKGAAGEATAAK
jgi:hypothetical protein